MINTQTFISIAVVTVLVITLLTLTLSSENFKIKRSRKLSLYTSRSKKDGIGMILPDFDSSISMKDYAAVKKSNATITRRMQSLSGKYMTKDQFNSIFSIVIPTDSKEPNIFLWQIQMMIKLQMHTFLQSLMKTGGKFYIDKKTIIDVSDVLIDLVYYNPDGKWTHDFMLILSIFNRINTGNEKDEKDDENDIDQWYEDEEPGVLLPVVTMLDFSYLITGLLQPTVTDGIDHYSKLAWNSGWSDQNYRDKKLDNAYGNTVPIPWNVLSETEEMGYMAYLYNDLANQALDHFNPAERPYNTNGLDENMFYDQTIALRRQDFNRRLNSEKQRLYSYSGCQEILNEFSESNGGMNGFSGFLTRYREELFDSSDSRRNPELSGWYFYIKYIQNSGTVIDNGFPSIVAATGKISPRNLLEIKRLEGSVKPLLDPTYTPLFGACRSVSKCRKCRSSCTEANCGKLRAHAAVDYYGRTDSDVRSTYDGVTIGISTRFFTDMCTTGGTGDASCPPGYSCVSSYCRRDSDGAKHYLPAITIKHVDGTIGRYGEFPLEDGISTGTELRTQQKVGHIVIYTKQCHFEIYSGEADIVPWISGGNPYDTTSSAAPIAITDMKNNFVSRLTVTQTPPRFVPDDALDYRYVPAPNYCISGCDFNCRYNRRCDLMNANATIEWSSRKTDTIEPTDIKLCKDTDRGITGVCIDMDDCAGSTESGLCSGSSRIKCCVD